MAANIRAVRIPSGEQFNDCLLREHPATESVTRTFNSRRNDVMGLFVLGKRIMPHSPIDNPERKNGVSPAPGRIAPNR
jgi:hypothetical protein